LGPREAVAVGEDLIRASGIDFRVGGDEAFYSPIFDLVQVPPQPAFFMPVDYYRPTLRARPDRSCGPRNCCATKRAIARTQLPTSFRPPIRGAADARRVPPNLAGPASP